MRRRRMSGSTGLAAIALILGLAGPASAAVPPTLTHQGRLFDDVGAPVNDTLEVGFTLFDGPNSSTVLWTETLTVTFEDGYFSVSLGDIDGFGEAFDGGPVYLEIQVDGGALSPRTLVASVPYALRAGDVTGDIHPATVSIPGFGEVIDKDGNWVGPAAGLQGPAGMLGPTGPAGPPGTAGAAGPPGAAGAPGPTGPAGAQGPAGPVGPQGIQGIQGPAGPQGIQGTIGPIGPQGVQGPIGPTGAVGAAGATGAVGPTGPTGAVGAPGLQGFPGAPGAIGPTGPAGVNGTNGTNGTSGAVGPTGPIGPAGATGPQGLPGAVGPTGPAGVNGTNGTNGAVGPTGPTGAVGPAGPEGAVGPTGPAGATGAQGPAGPLPATAFFSASSLAASLTWSSTTWAGVHLVSPFTDRFASGITRNNSTFTFAQTGTYTIHFTANGYHTNSYLAFRLRRLSGTQTTLLQRTRFSGASSTADESAGALHGLFQVSAGDLVELQYAIKNGTVSAWGASSPIDGETMVTAQVDIWKVQ